jgi:hypothetical protein
MRWVVAAALIVGLAVLVSRRLNRKPRCWRGHDWLAARASEFLPLTTVCIRCPAHLYVPPFGMCLTGDHPLDHHYRVNGEGVRVPTVYETAPVITTHPVGRCAGPQ